VKQEIKRIKYNECVDGMNYRIKSGTGMVSVLGQFSDRLHLSLSQEIIILD
jgi:hypothetical protein